MNPEQLQRLKEAIEPKLIKLLNDSKLIELLKEQNILASDAIRIEFKLDPTRLNSNAASPSQENQKVKLVVGEQEVLLEVVERKIIKIDNSFVFFDLHVCLDPNDPSGYTILPVNVPCP